jgi:micrococcal nuclease
MHTLHNRYIILLAIFFLLSVLSGCAPYQGNGYYARVVFVYDGDTVRLDNGQRVRYLGIDTPEMNYRNPPAERFAKDAKEFNKVLVANKRVRLEFDAEKKDKYDRLLAYVYVDDIFINARLVEEGYAKVYIIPPNIKYADELLSLEQKAKQKKKGIWSF